MLAAGVPVLVAGLSYWELHGGGIKLSIARDWVPLGLTLLAYREMDWFTLPHDHRLERIWVHWDRLLLHEWGLASGLESAGLFLPALLELSYLLVYAVGPFALAILYAREIRSRADRLLLVYLTGTLLAYALFPYFPSDPPRTAFPGTDLPGVLTAIRRINLWIVGGYGIHSSVFPSAHVSSAFSAAWALRLVIPERPRIGWAMFVYATLVAIATVYGRYHYAVDALAGFGVSLVALAVGLVAVNPSEAFPAP